MAQSPLRVAAHLVVEFQLDRLGEISAARSRTLMTEESPRYRAWVTQAWPAVSNGLYGAVGGGILLLIYHLSGCAMIESQRGLALTVTQNLQLRSYPATSDPKAVAGGLYAACRDPTKEVLVGGYCALRLGGSADSLAFSGITRQTTGGPFVFHCDSRHEPGAEPRVIAFAICLGPKS